LGTIADVTVAVTSAFLLKSVWALVFGLLAGNLVRCIMSYIIEPYKPRLQFDRAQAKELFGFGRWILGSSILVFLITQGDDIFVGKLLGATMLGFYQMAYRISNLPATEISHVISQVSFPFYSKLQDNLPKLREAYLKILQLTTFISFPVAGLIFILAPEFTQIFLGDKWMPMVLAMQVLALYGLLRAIGATTGAFFIAIGKPKIRTRIQSAQLILLIILIYPLTVRWGIMGTSIAVMAYALIFNLYAVYKVINTIESDYKKPTKIIIIPLIGVLIMSFIIFIIKTFIFYNIGFILFFLLVIIGIIIYLAVIYLFDLFLNYGGKELIKNQFGIIFKEYNKRK